MEKIVITGGSGLVGTQLTALLLREGYEVVHLGRQKNSRSGVKVYEWDPRHEKIEAGALKNCNYIIHLAGAGIADKRWTEIRKKELIESRTSGPRFLARLARLENPPLKGFFSASGINYYGAETHEKIFTEKDPPAQEFIADCVVQWEAAADHFLPFCRVAKLRLGMVLDKNEGALPRLARPAEFGLGAPLGSGRQYVPWIHVEDVCRAFLHLIRNPETEGVYNTVAPQHLTNRELVKAIAKARSMPAWLPAVPAFLIRGFLGEMSRLILEGSRASSEKLQQSGFVFRFPEINSALKNSYR